MRPPSKHQHANARSPPPLLRAATQTQTQVTRKAPLRTFAGRGGAQQRALQVELADAHGGQIAATFWREGVDK